MKTPEFKVQTRKVNGSPHTIHSIVLADGRVIWEQLSPYGATEAAERVAAFLSPTMAPPPRFAGYNGGHAGRPRRDPAKLGASVDYELRVDE